MKRAKPKTSKSTHQPASIVIADDHPMFLQGLRESIMRRPGTDIVEAVSNGELALQAIERLSPVIAVLDIDMPKMTGLQVAAEVTRRKLRTEVIILTMHDDAEHFENAMESGAMGYILKDSAAIDIVNCIDSVIGGNSFVSPALTRHLLNKHSGAKNIRQQKTGISQLTATERKVLKHISESKSTKQIADEMFVSIKTISAHRFNICTKLDIHGTNALLKFALEQKEKF